MDERIERALNRKSCIHPSRKTGWRKNGNAIHSFGGKVTEYEEEAVKSKPKLSLDLGTNVGV